MNLLRKMIEKIDIKLCNIYNRWELKRYNVVYGKNLGIRGKIFISMETLTRKNAFPKIELGKNIVINSSWRYNLIGEGEKTILRTIDSGVIKIGNNVGMSNVCIVSFSRVEIQDNVTIGGGVKIYDSDFHSLDYNKRVAEPSYFGINSKPILIKEGAFIGAGTFILKGVTIGNKSIIGAGSVVTKDVPDCEIWGGNPARFIRKIDSI